MEIPTLSAKVLLCALVIIPGVAIAQAAGPAEDDSYAEFNRVHVAWTSPESVLTDLRSANDETRLKALKLAGLTDQQAHEAVWSSGHDSPAKIIGQNVVSPSRTQLMYAALAEDASEQAIIAFEVRSSQATYAAVALRKGKGWERIAAMTCWCKYDMNPDQDMLAEFVSLRPAAEPPHSAPQHYELVVRSSGGGTGIYTQYEAHLRVIRDELRNSLQFVSRFRSSDPTGPTPTSMMEKRWFSTAPMADRRWGGILVEAKGTFSAEKLPRIAWDTRGLLDMHLHTITCRAYLWDDKTFRYERSNEVVPACRAPAK